MRILHLTLKVEPFAMIASGIKRDEYRDIKEHWNRIFTKHWNKDAKSLGVGVFNRWDVVHFTNGYGDHRPQMIVEFETIYRGIGKKEWGASGQEQYIIQLGKILSIKNYNK